MSKKRYFAILNRKNEQKELLRPSTTPPTALPCAHRAVARSAEIRLPPGLPQKRTKNAETAKHKKMPI